MRTLTTIVIALGIVSFAAPASAFCRSTTCKSKGKKECKVDENTCPAEGAPLFWPTNTISFALNKVGSNQLEDTKKTFDTLRKTFQAWTEVKCPKGGTSKLTFEDLGLIPCNRSEYNANGHNVNVIVFKDDYWKYRGTDGTLAKTSVTFDEKSGEIYDADIEINTANNVVTLPGDKKVEFDLQAIMTHEVGHFIGIAHSPNGDAVMAPTYSTGSTAQRKLTDDDIEAVCAIYPPDSKAPHNPAPRGGFSAACPKDDGAPGICSVSSTSATTEQVGTNEGVCLAVMGILAAARLSRRPNRLWRRS